MRFFGKRTLGQKLQNPASFCEGGGPLRGQPALWGSLSRLTSGPSLDFAPRFHLPKNIFPNKPFCNSMDIAEPVTWWVPSLEEEGKFRQDADIALRHASWVLPGHEKGHC